MIICTWNRAHLLRDTLASLTELIRPPGSTWEVLIVDNNSTDDTAAAAQGFADRLPLRLVREPLQGHSHARNRGLREAAGELLVWTDDDVLVDRHWLQVYEAAARDHPDVAFFGGTIRAQFEAAPPRWLRRNLGEFEGAFALREPGPEPRPVAGVEDLPYGANMAFHRAALADLVFDVQLGHSGKSVLGGEDTELLTRLLAKGKRGLWVGGAVVRHRLDADRLNADYVFRFFQRFGRGRQRRAAAEGTAPSAHRLAKRVAKQKRALRLMLLRNRRWAVAWRTLAQTTGALAEATESHL